MSVRDSKLWTLAVLIAMLGCVAGDLRRPTKVHLSCCEAVSKAFIPQKIKLIGYKNQNALTPCVEAVIFFAEEEKYCVDPTARWVNRKKKGLPEYKN